MNHITLMAVKFFILALVFNSSYISLSSSILEGTRFFGINLRLGLESKESELVPGIILSACMKYC